MNHYFNLAPAQARHYAGLKPGDEMVIVVPLLEQPPEGYRYIHHDNRTVWFELDKIICDELPYPINARVGMRETWVERVSGYKYKADGNKEDILGHGVSLKWRSAQSMPVEAIRYWGIVTGTRVDRVQNVIEDEIYEAGIMKGERTVFSKELFKDWFGTHYSKPRPRYKNGEIVGYECWCWDNEYPVIKHKGVIVYHSSKDGSETWTYKGRPLAIHANPWVLITTMRKE